MDNFNKNLTLECFYYLLLTSPYEHQNENGHRDYNSQCLFVREENVHDSMREEKPLRNLWSFSRQKKKEKKIILHLCQLTNYHIAPTHFRLMFADVDEMR
ncbi:CLUMA_CG007052, isoform A [Clunio marinus]|uniref:CLUMA_CG007052, isoform A n=1 Tax=Clunio marinus TaxID=568069 RepID=A0A1J1HZI2_9DIPT|nr:CLUMA_CG007052, isoform A [Clunio marinus]